ETEVLGGRPIEPHFSQDVSLPATRTIALGALVVSGRSHDEGINPHISTIVTEEQYLTEPVFDSVGFYPERMAAINRLTTIDQGVLQRLVIVPGQFKSVSGTVPTTGTQRLWDEVDAIVYYAPYTNTDYADPVFWQVGTVTDTDAITFTA